MKPERGRLALENIRFEPLDVLEHQGGVNKVKLLGV